MTFSVAFFMPKIISASTIAKDVCSPYDVVISRRKLENYRDVTENVLKQEEEKEYVEIEELLPKPVYSNFDYYAYGGWYQKWSAAGQQVWSHAFDLYRRGKIHGATAGYWCTFFAQMWFYDVYGFNSSGNSPAGDGSQFARTVYETAVYYDEDGNLKHYFQLDSRPMTLGIVSTTNSYDGSGHVLCVDEVDYINGTITISEGNVSASGDVRIRYTMSLGSFYAQNPGYKVYCNPTPELLKMLGY